MDDFDNGAGIPDEELGGESAASDADLGEPVGGGAEDEAEVAEAAAPAGRSSTPARARKSGGSARKAAPKKAAPKKAAPKKAAAKAKKAAPKKKAKPAKKKAAKKHAKKAAKKKKSGKKR